MKMKMEMKMTRTPLLESKKFQELFLDWRREQQKFADQVLEQISNPRMPNKPPVPWKATPYCHIRDTVKDELRWLYVKPSGEVLSTIKANMLVGFDVHFKIIIFANEAHVYAEYEQIIGSRLLAIIDPKTIPIPIPCGQ